MRTVYNVIFTDNRTDLNHETIVSVREGYTTYEDIPRIIAANGFSATTVTNDSRTWSKSMDPDRDITVISAIERD